MVFATAKPHLIPMPMLSNAKPIGIPMAMAVTIPAAFFPFIRCDIGM
jgi:hypothetical protein